MISVTAHAVGADEGSVPVWFLAYGGVAATGITAVALRSSWPRPRLRATALDERERAAREPAVSVPGLVGRAVGLALLAGVLGCALVGTNSAASNIAPVAVTVVWWVGLPLLCLVAGDVFAALSPFDSVVAAGERLTRREGREAEAPTWTAAAFLFAFGWFWLAYHRPGSPRAVAVLLVAYTVAAVAGGLRWGRAWLREGEGFAALSKSVASVGLWGGRVASPSSIGPVAVVWLGGTAFDAVSTTSFWQDVLGTTSGWSRTLLNSIGLIWLTAIVGGAVLLAAQIVWAQAGADRDERVVPLLGRALLPMAVGWFIAHDLTLLLFEGQNFLFLASDPLGRGWNLLGSFAAETVDYSIVDDGWVRAVEIAALLAGHLGAVVLVHDAALRRLPRRLAMRVTSTGALLAGSSLVAGVLLVLGGE